MPDTPLTELTVEQFLAQLGSETPAPGGGAAAALVGALAANLGRMACALTIGKPRFADAEPRVRELNARFGRAATLLAHLISEDAAAYAELNTAFKIVRTDPQRDEQVARAATVAAAVPLETLAVSRRVLRDLERLAELGNPKLAADIRAGVRFAESAMSAAAENVRANLPLVQNEYAEQVRHELDSMLA